MTSLCPNCGRPVADSDPLCPSCGAERPVWPPRPTIQEPQPPAFDAQEAKVEVRKGVQPGCLTTFAASLLTLFGLRVAWAMLVFSALGRHASFWVQALLSVLLRYGIPLAVVGVASLRLRPTRPHFARGLGYSALITAALFLGVFAFCR